VKRDRENRTEIVSFRVTKEDRALIDNMGGPTKLLRRALGRTKETISYRVATRYGPHSSYLVWDDGTIGPNLTVRVTP
jgi:hypothetical protein